MSKSVKLQTEVRREIAEALYQTDEIRAVACRCADCGFIHEADSVWLTICLFRDTVGKIEVQSNSIPGNWERFGDGYLCADCWNKIREWQAARRRKEAGI